MFWKLVSRSHSTAGREGGKHEPDFVKWQREEAFHLCSPRATSNCLLPFLTMCFTPSTENNSGSQQADGC